MSDAIAYKRILLKLSGEGGYDTVSRSVGAGVAARLRQPRRLES